jgi:signal transduction histidine kinase
MRRTDDQGAGGAGNLLIFGGRARRALSLAVVPVAVTLVAWSATLPETDDDFLLAHAVAALPFLVASFLLTTRVLRHCPPEYEAFWRPWCAAVGLAALAALAGLAGILLDVRVLLAVDAVLLVATVPLWVSATLRMLDAQAGRRDVSVDVLDAAMALIVLSAPGVLLLGESVFDAEHPGFAISFALVILLMPGALYVSFVNLERIPRGERAAQGIGLALAAALTVNVTLQLARLAGHIDLPLPLFVGVLVVQMALTMALPLWAHRRPTGRLARLGPEEQIRAANPMPYVSAVVLPILAVYVFLTDDERPWGVEFFCGLLLVVIVLNAIRYTLMSRETGRLSAELAGMAEERGRLLASMVRALEDDRHRTVTELHTQAVGSLATLSSIIQTAYVTLPGDTAQAVRETIAQLQGDLSDRAEELRQLMVAMRPRRDDEPPPDDEPDQSPLGTALLAYASELYREGSTRTVSVRVDPGLELDRSTMTIVYRIAQEALLNAARHARAGTVSVAVTAEDGGVLVEVRDDGAGFEPGGVAPGSGLATMQMFSNLGRGVLTVRSAPGRGTVVRSLLRLRGDAGPAPAPGTATAEAGMAAGPATPPHGHLRLVPAPDPTD